MRQIYSYLDGDNALLFGALFVMVLRICGLVLKHISTGKDEVFVGGKLIAKKELPFLRRLLAMPDILILCGIVILGGAFFDDQSWVVLPAM